MKKNNLTPLSLIYLIPLLDLFSFLGINNNITYILRVVILLLFIIKLLIEKKNIPSLLLVVGLPLLIILYATAKEFDIIKTSIFVINISFLPLIMLLNKEPNNNNNKRLWLLFLEYLIVFNMAFSLNKTFNNTSLSIIAILSFTVPFIIKDILNHHNLVTKYISILLIIIFAIISKSILFTIASILSLTFYVWKSIQKKDRVLSIVSGTWLFILLIICIVLNSMKNSSSWIDETYNLRLNEISENYNQFTRTNLEEQLFGTIAIKDDKTNRVDGVEIFYNIGYVGTIYYALLILLSIVKTRKSKHFLLVWLYILLISIISGSTLTSPSFAILVLLVLTRKETNNKKVLMVTNMYPSKKNKHYGSFVKNMVNDLESINIDIELVKITKHNNKLIKLFSYLKIYISTIWKSFIYSYDYFYAHFISHTTMPFIPAKIVSPKTVLIGNAHGNDIVVDSEKDENNKKRSKTILKYINKMVVPSEYYKEVLTDDYKYKEDRIIIYPSGGIDFTVFTQLDKNKCREELGLDEKTTYYGMISRIEKDKGWDTLISAIKELKDEEKLNNIKFIIIGRGDEEELLNKEIVDNELEDYIIRKNFVYQNELVKYYNALDLVIFPTKRKSESLGLVGLEAMAWHTPTIICTLYGPRSYANKDNSFIYKEENELLVKIKEYQKITDKDKELMIEKAYNTAKEYDKEKLKELLKTIFE